MDNRTDVREFLASRRARVRPEQAGLPAYGGNRRVPGLRREEVALLAGPGSDYHVRLERGNLRGVSGPRGLRKVKNCPPAARATAPSGPATTCCSTGPAASNGTSGRRRPRPHLRGVRATADPGLRMLVDTAEPATPAADAVNLLASWAATQDQADQTRAAHLRAEGER